MNRITINPISEPKLRAHILRTATSQQHAAQRFMAIGEHLCWVADAVTRQRPRLLLGQPTAALDLMLWRRRN